MHAQILMSLALLGPTGDAANATREQWRATPWTATDLRGEFRTVIERVRQPSRFDAERDVPALVMLHSVLCSTTALPRAERVQLRQRVEYWLEEADQRLRRERARLARATAKSAAAERGRHDAARAGAHDLSLAGGTAEARQVQQLIDLIQATIQPESWDSRGGPGTIRYYAPGYALVIRNNQQAHHEIGGLLGILGAAAQ